LSLVFILVVGLDAPGLGLFHGTGSRRRSISLSIVVAVFWVVVRYNRVFVGSRVQKFKNVHSRWPGINGNPRAGHATDLASYFEIVSSKWYYESVTGSRYVKRATLSPLL
jgi:hypothetical protein